MCLKRNRLHRQCCFFEPSMFCVCPLFLFLADRSKPLCFQCLTCIQRRSFAQQCCIVGLFHFLSVRNRSGHTSLTSRIRTATVWTSTDVSHESESDTNNYKNSQYHLDPNNVSLTKYLQERHIIISVFLCVLINVNVPLGLRIYPGLAG